MVSSFKEYIEEKYFDTIYNKVNSYIYNYRSSIPFRLRCIDIVHQAYLEDAYIKKFYVYDYLKDEIGMSIIVETNVTLKQYKYGEYIDDYDYTWFLIKCKCTFSDKITNFRVVSVEYYEGLDKEDFGLTDNLIPYIKKERLDDRATKILEYFYPEALRGQPVNPYEFAKRLKLTIEECKFKNPNKMGAIFFEDYKVKNRKGEVKTIPANTIMISTNNEFMGFEECKNFTIMHECVHHLLHRRAFQLERLFNKKAKSIECNRDGSGSTESKATAIDWMEWQANNLAPRLLMPAEPFKRKVTELFERYQLTFESNDYLKYYEQIMYDLRDYYGVPVESVKIRLIELGYEFPLGCFITVDGIPIPPHSFSKGSLEKNETFSVSATDAAIYSMTEKYFNHNDLIDGYIFVESHLCINHPKYIMKNENGRLTLTDYARHHMDECCIKFEIDIPKEIGHHEMNYKTFKMLNRRKGNHSELVVKAYKLFSYAATKNNMQLLKDALSKEDDLLASIPRTTKGLFKTLKDYSGYTVTELEDLSGLSKDTISNYLYKDNHSYTLPVVVKLLLLMNIPHKVTTVVLELCNCNLTIGLDEHQWLDFVLRNKWMHPFEENIKFLNDKQIYI